MDLLHEKFKIVLQEFKNTKRLKKEVKNMFEVELEKIVCLEK
jgi:hypothetical protein